jgi:hypothetical protein
MLMRAIVSLFVCCKGMVLTINYYYGILSPALFFNSPDKGNNVIFEVLPQDRRQNPVSGGFPRSYQALNGDTSRHIDLDGNIRLDEQV